MFGSQPNIKRELALKMGKLLEQKTKSYADFFEEQPKPKE